MLETSGGGTSTLVIHPFQKGALASRSPQSRLEEAVALAQAIELDVSDAIAVPVARPRPSTLLGEGKVQEIATLCTETEIELVVVDGHLSPIQQRNLEKAWKAKVIDRTGLILEIFGERAQTKEGRLQVELAHLEYQRSRLVRSWTHLERQRGGFGFLGGPGETQIETDRRLIAGRIAKIKRELEDSVRTRALQRSARGRVPYPMVALVGYTNAGKSTLFNALTHASVLAKDMLFATLDPTMREIRLKGGRRVILSDTVGFISDLPTELVAAFRATLEEVLAADLIIHVRDTAHPESAAQREDVHHVLEALGVVGERLEAIVEAWNKTDLLAGDDLKQLKARAKRAKQPTMLVSARTGAGLDQLASLIEEALSAHEDEMVITVQAEDGSGLAWAYANASVRQRRELSDGRVRLSLSVAGERRAQFEQRFGRKPKTGGRSR